MVHSLAALQACADKLEREIQLYCDPDKPGSPPVFPADEPDATVLLWFVTMPLDAYCPCCPCYCISPGSPTQYLKRRMKVLHHVHHAAVIQAMFSQLLTAGAAGL